MIGIVGGIGPLAGLDVFKKITEETPARKDQEHAPVLLFSLPQRISDRTEYLLGQEKVNPAHAIAEILNELENSGATVAGIPCNTAHAPEIFNVIEQELRKRKSNLRLLHMIREVAGVLRQQYPGKRVGILSTVGTSKTGIYRNILTSADIDLVECSDEWQERVHEATYSKEYGIKANSSRVPEKAISEIYAAMAHLRERAAEVIILGCTELPLAISGEIYQDMPLLDPNRILAKALLQKYSR